MVAKAGIVAAIDTMVKGTHKEWRIGVTNELADHDQFLAERPRWNSWQVDSLADAHAVETHFLDQGMEHAFGGAVSGSKAVYVYVF